MKPRRFAPRQEKTEARLHRADTCARASHQVSARFRPRTNWETGHRPDSPALHPLHSSRSSPAFRRNSIGSMPGLRSFVPTAANWRDRQKRRARPEKKIPEAARLRPARTTAIRREAPPIAEDTVVGREASPGQGIGSSREHGHFPDATLRWRFVSPPGNMADPAGKTKLVRDPVAGLRSLLSRIALVAPNPAIIPLRSSGGDSDSLASR